MAINNQLAFDVAERAFGIQPVIRGQEMAEEAEPDKLLMVLYLSKFYEAFRNDKGQRSSCFRRCQTVAAPETVFGIVLQFKWVVKRSSSSRWNVIMENMWFNGKQIVCKVSQLLALY